MVKVLIPTTKERRPILHRCMESCGDTAGMPHEIVVFENNWGYVEALKYMVVNCDNSDVVILMNDTFYFACADGEDITMEEIPLLYQLWKKFSWCGLVAMVSQKRKQLPLSSIVQTEEFNAALAYLNKEN